MIKQNKHHTISYVPWKNASFSQILGAVAKNNPEPTSEPHPNFIRNRIVIKGQHKRINYRSSGALPLKIYRKEIAVHAPQGNPRTSVKIDDFNRPQGNLVSSSRDDHCLGNILPMDLQLPNSRSENGTMTCSNTDSNVCMADNARRRVRSGGMVRDKSYCTDNHQYLTSRNRTFVQNQYNLVRTAPPSLITPQSEPIASDKSNLNVFYQNNMFVSNGSEKCATTTYTVEIEYSGGVALPYNGGQTLHNIYQYHWDSSSQPYYVFLPYGQYSLEDFTGIIINTMETNKHYYVNKTTGNHEYLLKFVYNYQLKKIEFQSFLFSNYEGNPNYQKPAGALWTIPSHIKCPYIKLYLNSHLLDALGFTAGTYPVDYGTRTTNYAALSAYAFKLLPKYLYPSITYKPSNYKYSTQGAVSSSSRLLRLQYNTINTVAKSYGDVFGNNVANAMAYRVNESINNFKDKLGYPLTKTPVFNTATGEMICQKYESCHTANP